MHRFIEKDLVLVGGGHAHVHVLKSFGMRPLGGVRLTLVTRDTETPYSGMLPGLVAGIYTHDESHIDLRRLARFAGARLIHAEASGLDLAARAVICRGRPPIRYDLLSLDTGAGPSLFIPGAAENGIAVKPVDNFLRRWQAIEEATRASGRLPRIVIVGGGAGGVELALAIEHRLRSLADGVAPREPWLTLATRHDIVPRFPARGREILREELKRRGIAVLTGTDVIGATPGSLACAGGAAIPFDEAVWVTGAAAPHWLRQTGLLLDDRGFVALEPSLRSLSDPHVFAAGDVATVVEHPRPKAGVFAVRQGPPLADNLRCALLGEPLKPFTPQARFLALLGTYENDAVATRGGWAAKGPWAWRLKQWIDRRWMRQYQNVPAMGEARAPSRSVATVASEPRCGGCGGKVPAAALARTLARLRPSVAGAVVAGLEAPDDAAILQPEHGRLLLQSVDFFRNFVGDPYVFGQIAATHALGDIYAMGGAPSAALAMAGVPPGALAVVEDELLQMLAGGLQVLEAAGARLVGGHSAETETLSLGFAVTGSVVPGRILHKGGLRVGDRLILTKPLGTGTLFAAEMRGRAKARWLDAAVAAMLVPAGPAARCFLDHGASACTDITGFGLLGHLVEMLDASGLSALIDLDAVPTMAGALDTLSAGITSSLHADNAGFGCSLDAGASASPRLPILFDPQTAGGLLAGVPAERAEGCLSALHREGYNDAAIIGVVEPQGTPRVRLQRLRSIFAPVEEPSA